MNNETKLANQFSIIETGKEQDMGLFWGTVEHVETGKTFSVNACLMARKDEQGFRNAVDVNDSGYNDGMCGDTNESLVEFVENINDDLCPYDVVRLLVNRVAKSESINLVY